MTEYEIYALKYAGPFKSSGAFLMWFKEWERVVERNDYIWCLKGKNETGVMVLSVQPGSAADEAQIRPGDILSEVNQIEIRTIEDYHQVLELSRQDRMILVLIKREETMLYKIIKLDREE